MVTKPSVSHLPDKVMLPLALSQLEAPEPLRGVLIAFQWSN